MIVEIRGLIVSFQNEQKVAFFGLQNAVVDVLPDGSVSSHILFALSVVSMIQCFVY